VTAEINRATEQRMKANDGGDGKLAMFRQQVGAHAHFSSFFFFPPDY
jgi:hypothetical protein